MISSLPLSAFYHVPALLVVIFVVPLDDAVSACMKPALAPWRVTVRIKLLAKMQQC